MKLLAIESDPDTGLDRIVEVDPDNVRRSSTWGRTYFGLRSTLSDLRDGDDELPHTRTSFDHEADRGPGTAGYVMRPRRGPGEP